MKESYDDRVREWWLLKNGYSLVILEDDSGVDDHDIVKLVNQMPCYLGSCTLGHSKRLKKNFIQEIFGLCSNNNYYGDRGKG